MNKLIIVVTLAVVCAASCKSADAQDLSSTMQRIINPIRRRLPSAPSMPSMPSMDMPSMPSVNMPDMSMPDLHMPKMPDMSMPDMPEMSMPRMPDMPGLRDLMKRMQALEQSLSDLPMSDLPKRTQKEVSDLMKRLRDYIMQSMLPDMPNLPDMPKLPGPRMPSPPRPRLP